MQDNPYAVIARVLGGQNTPRPAASGLQLGLVLTAPSEEAPDAPLTISVSGTVQEREDLSINAQLDPLGFAPGDQALLLPIDEAQRYIILCKVVSL